MGKCADGHRATHEAFNSRDWDKMRTLVAADMVYTDHPRGITMKSADEFIDWLRDWTTTFSDAQPTEGDYSDSEGDWSLSCFMGRGVNDGSMGPLQATNKRMDMPFWERLHFNADGKIDRGEMMYDQMTMLVQLGLAEAPPPA